jgi:predicted molibdopterin-dependent oxidoreductase YjgC
MSKSTLSLDGKTVEFTPGQTLLEVAQDHGVDIPTLCHLKGVRATGSCRICVVEVKGARTLMASCSTPAAPGMEVSTNTEMIHKTRKLITELLVTSGSHNCMTCESNGDCRLQDLVYRYGITEMPFPLTPQLYPTETENPFIIRDFSRCILCGRCVQACNEVVVNRAIDLGYRGSKSKVVTGGDGPYHLSDCVFCGQCVEVCPVGALTAKKAKGLGRPWEIEKVRTTCPYCGVGCQQWLHMKDGRIAKVTAVEDAMPNQGRLCVKGRFAYDFIYSDDRLKTPLIKENGDFREASWDEALDLVATKFKDIIKKDGPDAIAGVSCARSINEDSYQMQKLFRAVIGTNNIDHCART